MMIPSEMPSVAMGENGHGNGNNICNDDHGDVDGDDDGDGDLVDLFQPDDDHALSVEDVNYFLMLSLEWESDVRWMATYDNRTTFTIVEQQTRKHR